MLQLAITEGAGLIGSLTVFLLVDIDIFVNCN